MNRVLQTTLATVDAAICVSYVCRDNFILRTHLNPGRVRVIPNAVDRSKFTPETSMIPKKRDRIKVVVVSRLVYRKGVDLLLGIIPLVCRENSRVDFIIGGDGNKISALKEMVEREGLQKRVTFLGAVPHAEVRNVLVQGQIFLNCSLTESFCIAILEAACCGLLVVSTNVGGVPEVLPDDMILLAKPNVSEMSEMLVRAIEIQDGNNPVDPIRNHERVKEMYCWERVAQDTEHVYRKVLTQNRRSFFGRLECYQSLGLMARAVVTFLAAVLETWLLVVKWWQPEVTIDLVPDLVDSQLLLVRK